jgi:acetylornithine deacetylase/succinyl-diaminopimelate desuccinylase-like protein
MSVEEKTLGLITELVAFRTVKDNQPAIEACYDFVKQELEDLPFTVEEINHDGIKSMLWQSPGATSNKVLLNAHIDVVPASDGMYAVRRDGDNLIGRGVSDMKFGVASFITAIKEIYEKTGTLPPVDMLLTSDEESGGMRGVGHFVETNDPKYAVVIIPDGGDNWHIVEEAKGVLHLQIATKGKSAHASRPWDGIGAGDILVSDLKSLRSQFPQPKKESWVTTLNIGQIHVGKQTNQVPDEGMALVDIRYIPKDSITDVKQVVATACPNSMVTSIVEADPFKIDRSNPLIKKWEQLIKSHHTASGDIYTKEHGASDGRYFSKSDTPVILSKPVGGAIHTEEEWINLESVYQFTHVLIQYLEEFNQPQ